MTDELPLQRVEVAFVGGPPVQAVERAPGVSEVEIDGPVLRCLVRGSFQPFLEALRGQLPESRVVMMSAYGTPDIIQQAQALGVQRFLDKPFEMESLKNLVTDQTAAN